MASQKKDKAAASQGTEVIRGIQWKPIGIAESKKGGKYKTGKHQKIYQLDGKLIITSDSKKIHL